MGLPAACYRSPRIPVGPQLVSASLWQPDSQAVDGGGHGKQVS